MLSECVFCREVEGQSSSIFKRSADGLWAARWDPYPALPGHAEVIPVRHVNMFMDLSPDELKGKELFVREVMGAIARIEPADLYEEMLSRMYGGADPMSRLLIETAHFKSPRGSFVIDGWTLAVNDGEAAGRTVGHFHQHIIPRKEGDVVNSRGGFRRMFADDPYCQQ
ncbi:MAG TPA: HIT domain-containing protein [Candidatus Saccharimonadales bacterium]|nr:HIT domain-containing protein [Candidatus Saccharimonadales bacterium]